MMGFSEKNAAGKRSGSGACLGRPAWREISSVYDVGAARKRVEQPSGMPQAVESEATADCATRRLVRGTTPLMYGCKGPRPDHHGVPVLPMYCFSSWLATVRRWWEAVSAVGWMGRASCERA